MHEEDRHLYWHSHSVRVEDRWERYGHRSCVLWFTGLSAAGKSTLANALCERLEGLGVRSYVLDGDNIRHGLNRDLGFSAEDRKENIRRIAEVAKLFADAGLIVMTAFISPYREDRDGARGLMREREFIEVFVRCPLEVCEARDPKGIYRKAREGVVREFTGISAPYEDPLNPEMVLDTDGLILEECVARLVDYLVHHGYVRRDEEGIAAGVSGAALEERQRSFR